MNPTFDQVSDTALLVAAARAIETDREDGFVHDPFAAALAGERGRLLVQSMSAGIEWTCFAIGLRSRLIEEFIEQTIATGEIGTILNLGAGLDTRPWRLALPENMRWIEVDFPHVIAYKSQALEGSRPNCHVEQIAADLSSPDALPRVLDHAGTAGIKGTLLVTEGLLMYLSEDNISRIAVESHGRPAYRHWIYDIVPNLLQQLAHGASVDDIDQLRADRSLEGEAVTRLLSAAGWKHIARRNLMAAVDVSTRSRIAKIVSGMIDRGQSVPDLAIEDGHSGIWLCAR